MKLAAHSVPSKIQRAEGRGLSVCWSTGEVTFLSSKILRTNCPCASCEEKRGNISHQKPLSSKKDSLLRIVQASEEQETDLVEVWSIGNYAIGMRWGDQHNTGIYSFQFLRELVEYCVNESQNRPR